MPWPAGSMIRAFAYALEGHGFDSWSRTGILVRRGRDTREPSLFLCMGTEKRPCEDTVRRLSFTRRRRDLIRNQH